jgi:uncharacterized protein
MHITILGASGGTGRELTRQALDRGHHVTAISRDPSRIPFEESDRVTKRTADVHDSTSIVSALSESKIVVSGLGIAKGNQPGALTLGAEALATAGVARVIWLGAFGTGASAEAAGLFTRTLLGIILKRELTDKVRADTIIIKSGGTVFHAGPLTNGKISANPTVVALSDVPHRIFPPRISRATVAALMLDEAEKPTPTKGIIVPRST